MFEASPVPTGKRTRPAEIGESSDSARDEQSLQVDLVRFGRTGSLRAALEAEILALRHQFKVQQYRPACVHWAL